MSNRGEHFHCGSIRRKGSFYLDLCWQTKCFLLQQYQDQEVPQYTCTLVEKWHFCVKIAKSKVDRGKAIQISRSTFSSKIRISDQCAEYFETAGKLRFITSQRCGTKEERWKVRTIIPDYKRKGGVAAPLAPPFIRLRSTANVAGIGRLLGTRRRYYCCCGTFYRQHRRACVTYLSERELMW